MSMPLANRERFTYLGIAFVTYLLFRHVLGPLAGLDGWMLTIGAYLCAIAAATGYLYHRLRLQRAKPPDGE